MKCCVLPHFIGVFNVCQRICLGVSSLQMVNAERSISKEDNYFSLTACAINTLLITRSCYGKCSKISNTFHFCSQIKCWLSGLEFP